MFDAAPGAAGYGWNRCRILRGLWHHAVPATDTFRNGQPGGDRPRRYHRADGCAKVEEGDARRIRLGGWTADLFAALWPEKACRPWSFGERLPDLEPGRGKMPLPPGRGSCSLVCFTSSISPTDRGRGRLTKNIPARLLPKLIGAARVGEMECSMTRPFDSSAKGLRQFRTMSRS